MGWVVDGFEVWAGVVNGFEVWIGLGYRVLGGLLMFRLCNGKKL